MSKKIVGIGLNEDHRNYVIVLLFMMYILPRDARTFSNTFVHFSVVSYILHLQVAQSEHRVSKKSSKQNLFERL